MEIAMVIEEYKRKFEIALSRSTNCRSYIDKVFIATFRFLTELCPIYFYNGFEIPILYEIAPRLLMRQVETI